MKESDQVITRNPIREETAAIPDVSEGVLLVATAALSWLTNVHQEDDMAVVRDPIEVMTRLGAVRHLLVAEIWNIVKTMPLRH